MVFRSICYCIYNTDIIKEIEIIVKHLGNYHCYADLEQAVELWHITANFTISSKYQ